MKKLFILPFLLCAHAIKTMEVESQLNYFDRLPKELIPLIADALIQVSDEIDLLKNCNAFLNSCKKFHKLGDPIFRNNARILQKFSAQKNMPTIHMAARLNATQYIEKNKDLLFYYKNYGCSPLHMAANYNALEAAQVLISNGADINAKSEYLLETPLHYAVDDGSLAMVQLLINNNANIDAIDRAEETPLYKAIALDSAEMVRILLNKDCDLKIKNYLKESPLEYAKKFDNSEIIALLKEKMKLK